MTDKRETPLARWSRLKRADKGANPLAPHDDQLPEATTATPQETESFASEENSEDAPLGHDDVDLPDVADLNAESDFSAFLREGVSEEVRRKALRVLWRSDPVLANLDGLNDYDEDFRSASVLAEAVRTAYKAGKGYLSEEDKQTGSKDDPTPEVLEMAEEEGARSEEPETGVAKSAVNSGDPDASGEESVPGDQREKKSS